jgi:hypothetical protein
MLAGAGQRKKVLAGAGGSKIESANQSIFIKSYDVITKVTSDPPACSRTTLR